MLRVSKSKVFAAGLFALTVIAAALRLHRLGDPSLWADELFQISDALYGRLPGYVETLWGMAATGVDVSEVPREGYAAWREAGITEMSARLGPAVIGILTVALFGWLALPLLGRRGALVLTLLLAISTWHIEWSQQARFYAPMFFYYNAALLLYYRGVQFEKRGSLVLAMAFAMWAVFTKPTSFMLFGVFGIDLLHRAYRRRGLPADWTTLAIIGGGTLGALLLTWLDMSGNFVLLPETSERRVKFRGPFERPPGMGPVKLWALFVYHLGVPAAVCAPMSVPQLWRRRRQLAVFLVSAAAVPLLSFGALAPFVHVEDRYMFVAALAWLALAAIGLDSLFSAARHRAGLVLASLPILVVAGSALRTTALYYESGYGHRVRWRDAFDLIGKHISEDDIVITHDKWAGQYYLGRPDVLQLDWDFHGLEQLDRRTWFALKSEKFEISAKPHWLDDEADMRAVFPTRVPYPQTTTRIYLFRPSRNE